MGTISDKLAYLAGTKNAIAEALASKGQEVGANDTFRSYANRISAIPMAEIDSTPTEDSENLVTSGGVFAANRALSSRIDLLDTIAGAIHKDEWAYISAMVNAGNGPRLYPVGAQFVAHHDVYNDIVVNVLQHIGPDSDPILKAMLPQGKTHGMVMGMRDVIYSTQFDEVEAIAYCGETLTAGTYNITITRQLWLASDVGKTFEFTFDTDVPAGSVLCWDGYNVTREGRTLKAYPSVTSTTASHTVTMTEGSNGTSLNSLASVELNVFDRSVLGSNDYEESGVRQWLNANVDSNWFTPQTHFDRPVNYISRPGFYYGLDDDLKAVIVESTLKNRSNTVFDSHGTTQPYETTEKIFLLSQEEVGFSSESNIVCGKVFDFYKDATNEDRIKYDITSQSAARIWWLRTPYPSYAHDEHLVDSTGSLSSNGAYYGLGVVAAWII